MDVMGLSGEERKEELFERKMTENFPQINVRPQTTDPGNSKNTKQDKYPPKLYLGISHSILESQRLKKKKPEIGQS